MEALVIIGLIGLGLATSNNKDDNNHINLVLSFGTIVPIINKSATYYQIKL